jgi:hypothetical protein
MSFTVDAAGNVVDLTGTITFGNLSNLPAFAGFTSGGYSSNSIGSLNYISGNLPTGGISPTNNLTGPAAGLINLSSSCTDPHVWATSLTSVCLSLGYTIPINTVGIAASGATSLCHAFGLNTYVIAEDATCQGISMCSNLCENGGLPVGATAIYAAGVRTEISGSAVGIANYYGFDIASAAADPSSGTATGLWIRNGISGATTYAIKSDSVSQSTFAGSLSATAFIEAITHTPASSSAPGITGQIAWDTQYIYVCVNGSTPLWGRAALATTGW